MLFFLLCIFVCVQKTAGDYKNNSQLQTTSKKRSPTKKPSARRKQHDIYILFLKPPETNRQPTKRTQPPQAGPGSAWAQPLARRPRSRSPGRAAISNGTPDAEVFKKPVVKAKPPGLVVREELERNEDLHPGIPDSCFMI